MTILNQNSMLCPLFPCSPARGCPVYYPLFMLLIWLISATLPLRAGEEPPLQIEKISAREGLYQDQITTLFQDSRGFLWIGTSDGLVRYDGYEFTTFRYDPLDSTSLSGNHILAIMEDSRQYLWVRTTGGGVDRFNIYDETFRRFHYDPDDSTSLCSDEVTAILEDREGLIWIGTQEGLNLFNPASRRLYRIKRSSSRPAGLSHNRISVLYEDREGQLWIGTDGGGVNKLRRSDSTSTLLFSSPRFDPQQLRFEHFFAQGPTYLPQIYRSLDSLALAKRQMAAILHPGSFQDTTESFRIARPTAALLAAMGDGNAFGMRDYGWLERLPRSKPIWQMSYEKSNHAGGSTRNRIEMKVVWLEPGQYRLRFRSDGEHSFDDWLEAAPNRKNLWGIQIYQLSSLEARQFRRKLKVRITPNSLPHNSITAITQDRQGNLWFGARDGLAELNYDHVRYRAFSVYKHASGDPASLSHSSIEDLLGPGENAPDILWVRTAGGTLNPFDIRTGKVIAIRSGNQGEVSRQFLPRISAWEWDQAGNLWIGSATGRLGKIYLPRADSAGRRADFRQSGEQPYYKELARFPGERFSESGDEVTALLVDRSGLVWIGARRNGLYKFNPRKRKFRTYTHIPGNPQSLSHPDVTAILEDDSGTVWIGTSGGGLNKLSRTNPHHGEFQYRYFLHQPEDSSSLSSNNVSALYLDQSGNLWIGAQGGGLNRFDRSRKTFTHYRYDPHSSNCLAGNEVNSIYEDQYGQLWIGTNSGLSKFDRFRGRFTNYVHNPANPFSLSDNAVWAIYEDSYSQGRTLWVGTRSGGINKFDRSNQRFIHYTRKFDDPFSLSNPAILSIYQDKSGNLWFGTYSGGLNKFNRETEQFTYYTERDGLANNMIFGILEDRQGNLWLSTNQGVSQFNPTTGAFKNYDVSDGLQSNRFNPGAAFLNEKGEMFLGGANGFNIFFPDSIESNRFIPPLAITKFMLFGKPANHLLVRALHDGAPIDLSYRQNFLSFEFSALDFSSPAKNRYAFLLEGANEDWMMIGKRRFAAFTNLAPGEYLFRIRGSNSDGVWNEAGLSVAFIIHPPFWRTWWFYALFSALVIAVAAILHKTRVRIKLRRMLEYEQIRAQESERVRAKAAHDFHDELGHKLTKISLFSEILKRSINGAPPEVLDYLERISTTAKNLSAGMKDFIWTLDPAKDSLQETVVRLKDFGDELFDKTGVAFRVDEFTPGMERVKLSSDWRRHFTLLFKEAMNNTLKHAHARNVTLTVTVQDGQIRAELRDDGRGLPAELETRPGAAPNNSEATVPNYRGHGLGSMQYRARQLNGELSYRRSPEGGARIVFEAEIPQIGN